ncbi:MAG: tRNA (guanosine(37)-N1)-methyltransferase TrmD [Clostridia bacterium]|nr:tRNA (guanosine(37)-N1)-methyltransferase TrmD [Clostridia bacterium]
MRIDVLTVFPEEFAALDSGVVGRALQKGVFEVNVVNIRDYSADKHRRTDDYPFGGGAGMVMTPQPIYDAIQAVDPERKARRIYMSPRGRTFDHELSLELAREERILLLCGSYEGVDERVLELCIDEELSIGDYVLTGGELAAMVVINALSRHIDGVLGCSESDEDESFADGLLEYPQYTRPSTFMGKEVPEVLLNGHHAKINAWRMEKSLELTKERRPDLYEKYLKKKDEK